MKAVGVLSLTIVILTGVIAFITMIGALVSEADTSTSLQASLAMPVTDQTPGKSSASDPGSIINPPLTEEMQEDPMLLMAAVYANHYGITVDEATDHLNLQNSFGEVSGKLDGELLSQEAETYGGLWLQHGPDFKIIVAFTRDGEETLKKHYFEGLEPFLPYIEVCTVKIAQVELEQTQIQIMSILRSMNIRFDSGTYLIVNRVEFDILESDRTPVEEAIQRGKLVIPDYVRLQFVEAGAMAGLD